MWEFGVVRTSVRKFVLKMCGVVYFHKVDRFQ